MNMSRLAIALVIALALPFSVVGKDKKKKAKNDVEKIGDRDVDGKVNLYSIEKEIAMGKSYADEIMRTAKVVDDPVVAEYVNRVGQNLARHSDSQIPYHFKVIVDPQINAFALPGGFLFVNTGLIMEASTEAEMAGVLAHEIAHVSARHGTRQATRGQIANLATIPLMILTGGWGGYAIQQAAGLALPIAFMQFSREFEREADHLGIQYLYATGYDPTSFVDFFEKLASEQKTKPSAFASVFSSHPMTDDRISSAQENMQEILPSKPEYLVNTSEFDKVKERLAILLNPESRKSRLPDAPQVRSNRKIGVITKDKPGGEEEAAEEEDERPVLRRNP
jgi:predicted Zn-dependent protease